jgi:hypothetical protein
METVREGQIAGFNAAATFRLRVVAQRDTFTFYVNGVQVDTLTDSSISNDPDTEKYLGLMVGTYKDGKRNTVAFSDLSVASASASVGSDPPPDALFAESFADDNPNGWGVGKGETYAVSILNNALMMQVTKADTFIYSWPAKQVPEDVDITVAVQLNEADTGNAWGYGIGYRGYEEQESRTFYVFEVQGDGQFAVSTYVRAKRAKTLINGKITGFDPAALNELRVVVRGRTHSFYVNGKKVGTVQDASLKTRETFLVLLELAVYEGSNNVTASFTKLNIKAA